MVVAALVSLEEYLSTSYSPDCEYIEGRLVERNVGELNHSFLQFAIPAALSALGLRVYPEARCQVKADRFRVPDVLLSPPVKNASAATRRPRPISSSKSCRLRTE